MTLPTLYPSKTKGPIPIKGMAAMHITNALGRLEAEGRTREPLYATLVQELEERKTPKPAESAAEGAVLIQGVDDVPVITRARSIPMSTGEDNHPHTTPVTVRTNGVQGDELTRDPVKVTLARTLLERPLPHFGANRRPVRVVARRV